MNKQILSLVITASVSAVISINAYATAVNNGDVLTITTGLVSHDKNGNPADITSGSYYGVDFNGDSAIKGSEKVSLSQGTTGLVIGVSTTPGAYHSGAPSPSDSNAITAPDELLGNTGSWYSTNPITGSTTAGLDMSDWDWAWNGLPSVHLGGLAWQPTNCVVLGCTGYTFANGVGRFQWDGIYGHSYTLDTTSTVPHNDPSGFGDVHFYTHLEGTVTAVPIPGAAWLAVSGGMLLAGRRIKRRVV